MAQILGNLRLGVEIPRWRAPAGGFLPVMEALEEVLPGMSVFRPGLAWGSAEGALARRAAPALAEEITEVIALHTGHECRVGIGAGALGCLAATAREDLLEREETPGYLAPLEVGEILRFCLDKQLARQAREDLELLRDVGVYTLGQLVALGAGRVYERLGSRGLGWWRLARGGELYEPSTVIECQEYTVEEFFPEALREVSALLFRLRPLCESLFHKLDAAGYEALELGIDLHILHPDGNEKSGQRNWALDPGAGVEAALTRLRWQIEGWLTRQSAGGGKAGPGTGTFPYRPGVAGGRGSEDATLWRPAEWAEAGEGRWGLYGVALHGRKLRRWGQNLVPLWGQDEVEAARAAAQAAAQVQAQLGEDAVCALQLQGGYDPLSRVRVVTWGQNPGPGEKREQTWPGQLVGPAPVEVFSPATPARLLDERGQAIGINRRSELSAAPKTLHYQGEDWEITQVAGPYLVEGKWWLEPGQVRRPKAYLWVGCRGGDPLLLGSGPQGWQVEGRGEKE